VIEYLVKDIRMAEQLPSILGKGCLYSRLAEKVASRQAVCAGLE
jgi:hypothetical protein